MGIKTFGAYYNGVAHHDQQIAIWKISPQEINRQGQPSFCVKAIVVVTHGSLRLRLGERVREMRAASYADLSCCCSTFQLISALPETEGYIFLFQNEYVVKLFNNHPPFPRTYVCHIQSRPIFSLSHNAISAIASDCQSLLATLSDPTNRNQQEIVNIKIKLMYMDIARYTESALSDDNKEKLFSNRYMELFSTYVEELRLHSQKKRGVEYYASRLSVSPQYLTRIVRHVSGQTPSEIEAVAVLAEAKHLLDSTNKPIRQIAFEIGFADHAAFTKFFKRQTSLTPLQYRNRDEAAE